ncbi:MAG TPA: carboxypeptidase regulatory-like domain-containing protein [Fluviicola sp.]|nr:carboxypeptidase regulatory-like domain-containing protein [Fluviicola sp.]
MRQILLLGALFIGTATYAQNTYGDIIGTLVDKKNEPVWGAAATTFYGETMYRAATDMDGRFRISGIPAGTYQVFFVFDGDTVYAPEKVDVAPDSYGSLSTVTFAPVVDLAQNNNDSVKTLEDVEVTAKIKLTIGEAPMTKLTQKEIKFSPVKNDMKALVAGMNSDVRQTDDGSLVFRGARKGDLIYYIDGVKMNQVYNLPSSSLGYVMVYSGAIPAKYGDTNGGVIVVETRSYFDLLREYNSRMSLGE